MFTHGVHVSRVEFHSLFKERKTWMSVNDVLHHTHEVLWEKVTSALSVRQDLEESWIGIMVIAGQAVKIIHLYY